MIEKDNLIKNAIKYFKNSQRLKKIYFLIIKIFFIILTNFPLEKILHVVIFIWIPFNILGDSSCFFKKNICSL